MAFTLEKKINILSCNNKYWQWKGWGHKLCILKERFYCEQWSFQYKCTVTCLDK